MSSNRLTKFRIFNNKWLILSFVILFPVFRPSTEFVAPQIIQLYALGRYISFILVVFLYLRYFRVVKIPIFSLCVSLLFFVICLSTYLHHQDVGVYVVSSWMPILISLFFIEFMFCMGKGRYVLRCLVTIFTLLLILNLYFSITAPGGFDVNKLHGTFLGHKNSVRNYAILAIALSLFLDYMDDKQISFMTILLIIISIWAQLNVYSATGVVVTIMLVCLAIAVSNRFRLNYFIVVIGCIFLNFVIITGESSIFKEFIQTTLDKDMTFTGRDLIWATSIDLIEENPILGLGAGDNSLSKLISESANTPHNAILSILFMGGCIALACFFLIVVISGVRMNKSNSGFAKSLISISLLAFLVSGVFEHLNVAHFYILLLFGYYLSAFTEPKHK